MNRRVKAVKPFLYPKNSNFKIAPYEAWKAVGGAVTKDRPYEKWYESLSYHIDLPNLWRDDEVRLRFVEGACVKFDTFPDYLTHEVIPVIWDCWPSLFDNMSRWFGKHKVRTAFFTSSQTGERMRRIYPDVNIIHLPEAIETDLYKEGRLLRERKYDYLEFGRVCNYVDSSALPTIVNILSSKNEDGALKTREMLIDALSDSKITICLPRCVNQPEIAGDVETLTQRYWECMLSRVVILGKAPKELIDIIGYDPVVNLDKEHFSQQVEDILCHIEDYQPLVDKNREMALKYGDWKTRMQFVKKKLTELEYTV